MLVIESLAREYFREKYGKELPYSFRGIDNLSWSEEDVEFALKILNEKCVDVDFKN